MCVRCPDELFEALGFKLSVNEGSASCACVYVCMCVCDWNVDLKSRYVECKRTVGQAHTAET